MPASTEDKPKEGTLLERLLARRSELAAEIEPLVDGREEQRETYVSRANSEEFQALEAEARKSEVDAYEGEEARFTADLAPKLDELRALDVRIAEQQVIERSRELAQNASRGTSPSLSVTSEPLTYRQDNQKVNSYWLDLAASQIPQVRQKASGRIDGYQERLDRHAKEMESTIEKRSQERSSRAQAAIDNAEREFRGRVGGAAGLDANPFESRAPNRTPGQGGYFVPPLWLVDEYIPALRPGRVAAGLCRQMPLPEGTDSINIPKVSTPTLTGIQQADNYPVVSRDFTDTFVQANVKTIAGQEDIPIQLIEQSPGQILDQVITTDLMADYNQRVDLQVLTGNGVGAPLSGGQILGIYPSTNWGATGVTWTAASPTAAGFFQVLGAMLSKTAYTRFSLADFQYLFHPRRAGWWLTATDSAGRPLVTSPGFSPFNVQALEQSSLPFEGRVADLPFGPAAYMDANVPTTDSSGTPGGGTADVGMAAIWDDVWFFEGDLRTRVLSEVLSGTLELRFQIYNYIALLVRYGPSIVLATGSGFAAPVTVDGTAY
jgi:hypothetical protein